MTFKENESELLKTFLNSYFLKDDQFLQSKYNPINNNINTNSFEGPGFCLELILRPQCDQHCQYCYIANYGEDLYPIDSRQNKEGLLKNLFLILDYFFNEKKVFIRKIELFAGDLFSDNLFFDVCDIIYKFYEEIYQRQAYLFSYDENYPPVEIIVPNNFNWIENEIIKEKIREKTNLFRNINITLGFSCSTDGLYNIDIREQKQLSNEYYDKLFSFIDEMGYGLHPMVSAEGIDNMINNYNWWMSMCKKYLSKRYISKNNEKIFYTPMFLEVRNDNWTKDKIQKYLEWLNYVWEYRLMIHDNDIEKLARHLFLGDGKEGSYKRIDEYDPLVLFFITNPVLDKLSCSLQNLWHINVNDLTFPLCHRLAYKQFQGGKFVLNEDNSKIIDIEAINPTPYIAIKTMIPSHAPKCALCEYKTFCLKGCLGSQYESSGELLLPINSVCNFMKAKIDFILNKYYTSGVFQIGLKNNYINQYEAENLIAYYQKRGYDIQI